MPIGRGQLVTTGGVVTLTLYPILDHAVLVTGRWPHIMAGLAIVQVFLMSVLIFMRANSKYRLLAIAALGLSIAVLWRLSAQLSLVAATGLPHAAIYFVLLAAFSATLLPGREAFVTTLARRISGPLDPEIFAYTRHVTWAWCLFFAAQLFASVALFLWARIETWSLFVNVLNPILLLLMFAGEYGYRLARFRDPPRQKLSDFSMMVDHIKSTFAEEANSG
jgi:uncharacterized membrane protein